MPKKYEGKKWEEAHRKALRALAAMTDDEDAEIKRGIARDPGTMEITDEMWARMRPASEVHPDIVAGSRRTRGKQKAPTKKLVSVRLDQEVVDHFRDTGPGWQTRINDALRKAARLKRKAG